MVEHSLYTGVGWLLAATAQHTSLLVIINHAYLHRPVAACKVVNNE